MLGPTGSGESETDVCYLFFVSWCEHGKPKKKKRMEG
jgi:hypothetical protein